MTPILVTAPGRSGTTLLMGTLAHQPQITVAEIIPYEVRLISYYATAYRTLTAPADPVRSMSPDRLEGNGLSVGFCPFNSDMHNAAFKDKSAAEDFWTNASPASLASTFGALILDYYDRLARDQRGTTFYFAEKNNDLWKPSRDFCRLAFGRVKELVIIRDPRDIYCSHKSYFKSDPGKAMSDISAACRALSQIIDAAEDDLLAIKYETAIQRPAALIRDLSLFLDFGLTQPAVEDRAAVFNRHGTTESPLQSIGRWRTDMTDEEKQAAGTTWGDFLRRFGYDS